ncbi:hypothetical protein [Streptomyces sp. TLI_146]|nr:hypothetical protein [Streptomyces sp. TLI_146]PKV84102.1 hypothetical protein BX283_1613 [Streptomyces sp. TLI_146]
MLGQTCRTAWRIDRGSVLLLLVCQLVIGLAAAVLCATPSSS